MKEKYYVVAKTITRWKLNNPIENWLGQKADTSECWKKIYVLYYKLFDYQYYSKGLKYIEEEIAKQRPNLQKTVNGIPLSDKFLRRDMIYSLHRFGINFFEYFVYKLYNKSALGRERINNLRIQYGYCELVNSPTIRELFDNKAKTYELLKSYYKRDLIAISSFKDVSLFSGFLKRHKSFIYKPLKGVHGLGIKIYIHFEMKEESFIEECLKDGPFVIEELIEQAPEMANLHSNSINTIRVATFRIDNQVTIYGAAMRMGTGNAYVDNAGSGGIFCRINPLWGFVETNAMDYKGNEYIFHPDTNVRFIGFEIPMWDDLIALVKSVAIVIDGATMISWDFALGKEGWVLLEANDVGDPDLVQDYEKGNKSVLHELMDKYFEYRKQSKK